MLERMISSEGILEVKVFYVDGDVVEVDGGEAMRGCGVLRLRCRGR